MLNEDLLIESVCPHWFLSRVICTCLGWCCNWSSWFLDTSSSSFVANMTFLPDVKLLLIHLISSYYHWCIVCWRLCSRTYSNVASFKIVYKSSSCRNCILERYYYVHSVIGSWCIWWCCFSILCVHWYFWSDLWAFFFIFTWLVLSDIFFFVSLCFFFLWVSSDYQVVWFFFFSSHV